MTFNWVFADGGHWTADANKVSNMRFCRYKYEENIAYGLVEADSVREISGSPFSSFSKTDTVLKLTSVDLLAPCEPTKIIAVGLNYIDHAHELGMPVPDNPIIFLKPISALIGDKADIIYPAHVTQLDYEAELAVVIGSRCRNVDRSGALCHVLGYTCANDVTARDLQRIDGQWTRAKSFDTFAPIGPWIETQLSPDDLRITMRYNGEIRQDSSTSNMIFDVPALVEFISSVMTLEPGDVIMTGTPPGVGSADKGAILTVEIEGIGVLSNTVA